MKRPNDCYLAVRFDEGQKSEVISAYCTKCGKDEQETWFWDGTKGYSNYKWECVSCGFVIHMPDEALVDG